MTKRTEAVKSYFDTPKLYLHNNFNIELRRRILATIVGTRENDSILDVGAGDGSLSLHYLSQNYVTFLDAAPNMLAEIERKIEPELRLRATMVNEDILEWTSSDRFDLILCIGVLAHVVDVKACIAKLASLLAPDGVCVIQISDRGKWLTRASSKRNDAASAYKYRLNRTTAEEIEKLLYSGGLKVESRQYAWRPYPFLRILPRSWRRRFLISANERPWIASWGTELFIAFSRNSAAPLL